MGRDGCRQKNLTGTWSLLKRFGLAEVAFLLTVEMKMVFLFGVFIIIDFIPLNSYFKKNWLRLALASLRNCQWPLKSVQSVL
jgi:hypothetical protein